MVVFQGIQVSESSEYTDGDDLCCDAAQQHRQQTSNGQSPDGLSDSMTAVADDLCPSNQLRSSADSSASSQLQLADYSKHKAKQAMTVSFNSVSCDNNNDSNTSCCSQADVLPEDSTVIVTEDEQTDGCAVSANSSYHAAGVARLSHIDLSAIVEEAEESTTTSMQMGCSHDTTPSVCVSTPDQNGSALQPGGINSDDSSPILKQSDGQSYLSVDMEDLRQRSHSNPELYTVTPDDMESSILLDEAPESTSVDATNHSPPSNSRLLLRQKSFSDDQLNITLNSSLSQLACEPAKASFVLGDMPGTPPSTPSSPLSPELSHDSCQTSFTLPHVESDAKLSSKSPLEKKSLSARIRRSLSYTTAGSTPPQARYIQQKMNLLTFEQVTHCEFILPELLHASKHG